MLLKKSVIAAVAVATLTVSAAFATVPAQTNACNYQFPTNLRLGAVSQDVQNLQKLLNMDAATRVSVSGAGSAGAETFRFGPATLAAVKKFQAANGISPVSGYVGPLTRGVLNTICSSTVSTTPTTNTGSGVVSNNIPVSVLVAGQANAKLAEFTVSGNGIVTGIELMRTGLSNNATLENVYLYDGATRLTSGSSVLTNGVIRFNSASGLFPVNGSRTITVRADILTSTSGQTVGVAMTNVTMMGGTATPVTGAQGPLFSISSATLGGANFTTTAPSPSATTINAGSMNQTIWSNNLNVSTNAQKLHGMTFKMIGSAPANTLANVKLFVDGVERGMASMNSMNQYVFSLASAPVMLNTGSHFIELRADVVAGASRNFYMSVEEATDVMIEDTTLPGIMITPSYLVSTTRLTNLNGGTVTINQGSLTINQDTAFNNTTTLVSGATNVKMAAWKITSYGEDVKITSLTVNPQFTSGASSTLQNVGLYVNGGQVGSNQTTVTHNTNFSFNSLGTNLLVPAGQTVTVEIRGDVTSGNVAVNSGSVQFSLVAGTNNAQGMTSFNTTGTSGATGQSLTIASSNVSFAVAAGSAASTKSPNSQNAKIGSFTMQTGSAEGVTVNQIAVALDSIISNQVTNLKVMDGSTVVGTPIGNPIAGTNNFSANVSIPMNTTKTFDVYADFGSASAGGSVTPTMTLTYRGNSSNLTTNTSAQAGVANTVAVAALTGTSTTFKSSSFPAPSFLIGGASNVSVGSFNVVSYNGVAGAVLKDVTFTVPANTVSSVTVNGKTASVVGTTATINDIGITVPSDASGVDLPVTVSLVCVNTSGGCAGVASSTVSVTLGTFTYNNGTSVLTVSTSTAATLNNALVSTKPTVTMAAQSTSGLVNGINKIGTFTVAADASGDIKLQQIPVNTTVAGACTITASTVELRDADGNNVISGVAAVSGGAANFVFSTPRTITKGTSETYSVYATLASCSGNAGTQSASFTLGSKSSFLWTDVLGAVTSITGDKFTSYPNVSQTKTN